MFRSTCVGVGWFITYLIFSGNVSIFLYRDVVSIHPPKHAVIAVLNVRPRKARVWMRDNKWRGCVPFSCFSFQGAFTYSWFTGTPQYNRALPLLLSSCFFFYDELKYSVKEAKWGYFVFLNIGVDLLWALDTVSHGCRGAAHLHSALLALALNFLNAGFSDLLDHHCPDVYNYVHHLTLY